MLLTKLQENLKNAMLSKDSVKVQTIRFLISEIKNKEINTQKTVDDTDIIQIIKKQVKELESANAMFGKAGRQDLIDANKKEITILSEYLPNELTDEELTQKIKDLVSQNQEVLEKNPKSLMGIAVGKLKPEADPQRILSILKQIVPNL